VVGGSVQTGAGTFLESTSGSFIRVAGDEYIPRISSLAGAR
jgi:hypothetical protein